MSEPEIQKRATKAVATYYGRTTNKETPAKTVASYFGRSGEGRGLMPKSKTGRVRVKGYTRKINGKRVRVKGHLRKR
ncbi:hypothetical protein LCGC14_0429370 [marine sediment metagenome]|uniref:Uncharacterized protein n=1 Tax=marine sediment metagenome TaxID=412755 RepID=A0A0F9T6F8_9ZZZZ